MPSCCLCGRRCTNAVAQSTGATNNQPEQLSPLFLLPIGCHQSHWSCFPARANGLTLPPGCALGLAMMHFCCFGPTCNVCNFLGCAMWPGLFGEMSNCDTKEIKTVFPSCWFFPQWGKTMILGKAVMLVWPQGWLFLFLDFYPGWMPRQFVFGIATLLVFPNDCFARGKQ